MAFLDGLMDLFPHTVSLEPWTGQNDYGEATYGDAVLYPAKIEQGVNLLREGFGDRTLVPKYKIILGAAVAVDARDRVVLDVAFGSRNTAGTFVAPEAIVYQVKPLYDEQEHVSTIVFCG
jgi:hypothetical protein